MGNPVGRDRRPHIGHLEPKLALGGGSTKRLSFGLKRIALSGGEPLLHPEFDRILGVIARRGLEATLLTNGILLDAVRCETLSAAGCRILVSIHGPNADIHDRLSGGGTFTKALLSTELLLQHLSPEMVTINCTLSDWNLDRIEKLIELAEEIGVGGIRFMPLHRPGIQSNEQPELDYQSENLQHWARTAAQGLAGRRWKVGVSFGFTGLPGAICEEPAPASQLPCEVGRKLVVAADGEVYPCTLLMSREFLLGTVEEGLDKAITSPAFSDLVAGLQNRHVTVPCCASCALGGICRGGCPALAWQTSGDFNRPDPLCAANLAYSSNYFSLVTKQKIASTPT